MILASMGASINYVLGIAILFFCIVAFHEFGHFIIAKFFGVRVDVFSIGFGKKIFKKTWRGTEYCLSLFPLGGYVKIYGQDPSEQSDKNDKQSFSNKPLWQRVSVVAAGPGFNFILAIFLFIIMATVTGIYKVAPRVARVVENSTATQSGFLVNDEILAINNQTVSNWDQIESVFSHSVGSDISVRVRRGTQELDLHAPVVERITFVRELNKIDKKSGILGLENIYFLPILGVDRADSHLAMSGLKHGDLVLEVNGQKIETWDELKTILLTSEIEKLNLKILREEKELEVVFSLPADFKSQSTEAKARYLGLNEATLYIADVMPDKPAHKAGVQKGDYIVSVNNQPVWSHAEFTHYLNTAMENEGKLQLGLRRQGEIKTIEMSAAPNGKKWQIGVSIAQYRIQTQHLFKWKASSFFEAVTHSFAQTGYWIILTFKVIGGLFAGAVSTSDLGGPIAIGDFAGKAFQAGMATFLWFMALMSINLGVLNFFPLPVLDGGHLLFFSIEAIRRKPLSEKAVQFVNITGIVLLGMLLLFVFYNDFSRIFGNSPLWKKLFG